MYAFDFFYWTYQNGFFNGISYILLTYLSRTGISNFNENDVNQSDNLASKNGICTLLSTPLDELNWILGN